MRAAYDVNDPIHLDFLRILSRSTDRLNDDPVREEVFSVERLEAYAPHLAKTFKVSPVPKRARYILPKLNKNGRLLLDAYLKLTEAFRDKEAVSPAAEWFVDNFHIVEEQLREIKQDLPTNYYDELPKLSTGELQGYPRVYGIALAIIAHTDSRLDAESLKRFIRAYQEVSPLTIGELWATAITLRIALVEHLTPLALRIVSAREKRNEADEFADSLLHLAALPQTTPNEIVKLFTMRVGHPATFNRAFIVQLTQRLRDQDPDMFQAFDWLEKQLASHYHTQIQTVVQLEHNRQATAQVTVGNIITSMRFLSALDWRDFIESVSLVDPILNKDPAGAYSQMDFTTRDRYRHAIERLAKQSPCGELQVARRVVATALKARDSNRDLPLEKRAHIGFYLIGDGQIEFQKSIEYRPQLRERLKRGVLGHPSVAYFTSLFMLTVLGLVPIMAHFRGNGGGGLAALGFLFLAIIPASEFALSVLNHIITLWVRPLPLPKIDTSLGVPPDATTMVVIPTILANRSLVQELLEGLQVHFLANQDPHIYFALLADVADAATETLPEDATLLKAAQEGIDSLNKRYGKKTDPRFFLFWRKRLFNSCEGKWMGYERKRGKIEEFNRLLRGATDTTFVNPPAKPDFLSQIQYVITLDSDTKLPRGAGHSLIGTALHPLNRPDFDPDLGRVVSGYGIFQPRISVALTSANRTRFSHLFSGASGLDPYTTACSDVYQDLFGEGSYTGKGLYRVDAFQSALKDRTPKNTILSHDLFEGCFARCALVSDIELFDDYPTDFEIYSKRQHRWIRGDWQIAPWALPLVPTASSYTRNRLPLISRWKILDNLRRSLVAPAVLLWLWFAWTCLPGSAFFWTLHIVLLFSFPLYASGATNLLHNRRGVSWRRHVSYRWSESYLQTRQILVMMAFLPNQAANHADAIVRTLYRQLISHRKLLEWTAFADAQHSEHNRHWLREMAGPGPIFSLCIAATLFFGTPSSAVAAAPFLIAWFLNPFLARWERRGKRNPIRALTSAETAQFRLYARRTWHFFERFVTNESNFLAPDNFQEEPQGVIAHRTSPTNIGVQLLSLSSAYDLGYVGHWELIECAERVFASLSKLERLHGHYFNWYDTRSLEALRPRYISTVDSGNLAGHLLTLKRSFLEIIDSPPFNANAKEGLLDTLKLIREESSRLGLLGVERNTLSHFRRELQSILDVVMGAPFESIEGINIIDALKIRLSAADSLWEEMKGLVPAESLSLHEEVRVWLNAARHQVEETVRDLHNSSIPTERIEALVNQCDKIVLGMDFTFLFDGERQVFVIGYNAVDHKNDNSYYDLLASESRLASLVAIAKGDVPQDHWFRLGRQLTMVKGGRALISWTGTMFEYLMPLLVTRNYPETLLSQTYHSVVKRQIEYGKINGVPWGVSESEYNMRDLQMNFQYRAFGIPGLGLKRGLSDDLVISPYSSMLAAPLSPLPVLSNLRHLEEMGALSRYGFYEAIDYTSERLKKHQKCFILRCFMAHHQGMGLISINNLLNGNIMQRRFHSEPLIQATQLLLQERIPFSVPLYRPRAEEAHSGGARLSTHWNPRIYTDPNLAAPRTQLLSNGTYSVMVTTSGSGYSRSGNNAVTRWREDATRDHWGQFFYIRNRAENLIWSPGYQPTLKKPKKYEVSFNEDKVEFWREDGTISTHTDIIVSPEENVEIRRISLTNASEQDQELEITSYLEVALAAPQSDEAHPAFSNLFIHTEFVPNECALLANRRRRSSTEEERWAFHVLLAEGEKIGSVQYETDRAAFLGRGRAPASAAAITEDRLLSNTVGAVLDPIFSLRQSVRIAPSGTARLIFATGVTRSREDALRLIDKYHDIHIFDRETELAWTASRVQLRHLNIDSEQTHTYQRLASRVIYSDSTLRPRADILSKNTKTQSGLWAYGISGDLPIVIVRIRNDDDMAMVRELLRAHEYLRLKGLSFDLVLLNERDPSYFQTVDEEVQKQIRMIGSQALLNKRGGVFNHRTDLMPDEDIVLLKSVARVVLDSRAGTLREQLKRRPLPEVLPEKLIPSTLPKKNSNPVPPVPPLEFFNGLGGFTREGREYVIVLNHNRTTPAPWINVVANESDFGFLISESGAGYTWSVNSRENRLTPWSNDAITDPGGETLYIRDEQSGEYWTPTPMPIREEGRYVIRHGQGYTRFEYSSRGIVSLLTLSVPLNAEVKIASLRIKNSSREQRRLSVTSFVEWVLGVNRSETAPHVITQRDETTGAILARNSYNNEFNTRVAFSFMSEGPESFTCDRREFIGRNGHFARPAALTRVHLSGRTGPGLDPCAAFQKKIDLMPNEEKEIVVLLGQANSEEEARALIRKYRLSHERKESFSAVVAYWDDLLGTIQVKTPDPAMNLIMNRWLLYQTLSCRVWGRSAFYQSGGAFGFRDQLQDVMALVYARPQIARKQILLAAARQFVEGDVLHWWHAPTGRGVRTHISDDLLWLPFVVSQYVRVTGERSLLEAVVPFIEAPRLDPRLESAYLLPVQSQETATVLEHCARALDRSLLTGRHGLPLMGGGDWNDGMNRVGHDGKGESVWLGWFLYNTLKVFTELFPGLSLERVDRYRRHMGKLQSALGEHGWDGHWYRRAYFDDGTPMGSIENAECQIDSLANSWSVLSGMEENGTTNWKEREKLAMEAIDRKLIDRQAHIVKLLAPPFDMSAADPGYIKGYLPGVRENGGQYTHAALWMLMAFAARGDGDRAGELFNLLNPISHSSTDKEAEIYKVEPYAVAADVYGVAPHVGRGGWTWYTGSSSWMYRAGLESLLGFRCQDNRLSMNPSVPKSWGEFQIIFRRGHTRYIILATRSDRSQPTVSDLIPLIDDGKDHEIRIQF